MPGMTLPYWFLNVSEVIGIMAEHGYALIYKNAAAEDSYDQSNFPEAYRLGYACNLLFARASACKAS